MPSDISIPSSVIRYCHVVEKLWGGEAWFENNNKYCLKLLELKHGFQSSLHYHQFKDETFVIISGTVILELYKPRTLVGQDRPFIRRMTPGDKQRLFPGVPHRFYAETPEALVLEVSTPHDDEDVVRLEESRKRDDVPTATGTTDSPQTP